jgi:hypothetical protein
MSALIKTIPLVVALSLFASCATVGPGGQTGGLGINSLTGGGGTGILFTSVGAGGAPLYVEGSPLVLDGLSRGESSEFCILGLITLGDSSIDYAALEGGLRDVRYVDRRVTSLLGIFTRYTTVVLGETKQK